MLEELSIKNYAVIEQVNLKFTKGLNVFTGETGAGKSIIVEAVSLLLGARASAGVVRQGADKMTVTGVFYPEGPGQKERILQVIEKPDGDTLILRREIDSSGRSKCYCNDEPVTAGFMEKLGDLLVDIHGQHEHQTLLKTTEQLKLVDRYGGQHALAEKTGQLWKRHRQLIEELEKDRQGRADRERMTDLYKFQLKEIESAGLKPDEEERMERILPSIKNTDKLLRLAAEALCFIDGSSPGDLPSEPDCGGATASSSPTLETLQKALNNLREINSISGGRFADDVPALESVVSQLDDVAGRIKNYCETINMEPAELDRLIERKDLISKLKKKYGATVTEIIEYGRKVKSDLERMMHIDDSIVETEKKLNEITQELREASAELSKKRKKACVKLEASALKELRELGMPKASFSINVGTVDCTSTGIDLLEFLFSANPGEKPGPLKEIASGGEMSRTMLAIKTVLGNASDVPVMIFDEIDAGVSGPMGSVLGKKLLEISGTHQAFCITHLPQIACFASPPGGTHFRIEKSEKAGRTYTTAAVLKEEQRVDEISRMLSGGTITKVTRQHAVELLSLACKRATPRSSGGNGGRS